MLPHSLSLWSFTFLLFFLTFFFLPIPTLQTTLISPVSKDKSTHLFTLSAYLKTPLQPTKLFLDLAFLFPWTVCDSKYKSSSYRYVDCDRTFCYSLGFGGPQCSNCTEAGLPDPNCNIENRICGAFPENLVTRVFDFDAALIDTLALPSADVSTKSHLVSLPNYTFSCAHPSLLRGLPKGVTGLASLSRYNLSIPNQISSALSVPNTFAVCFPGSSKSTGVAFFGSRGPYYAFSQNSKTDLSKSLIYTPLLVNPDGYGDTVLSYSGDPPSYEYFVNLTSIRINGQSVPINASLLDFRSEGFFHGIGGTKFSSNTPYSHLESSIYKAFTKLFVKEASSSKFNLTVSSPAKPFSVCYAARSVKVTSVGPVVPTIDLELGGKKGVVWRIVGANSMVKVKKFDLWCLGFVDNGVSGVKNKTSIVIGAKQLEENLMQFDIESNKLGFTSLLNSSITCGNFNVTDFAKNN